MMFIIDGFVEASRPTKFRNKIPPSQMLDALVTEDLIEDSVGQKL
jgi:hypothetical protein